ncbi:MAG: Do family serine endopeptidase [Thiovulaceae bacterium]|nr:Do family serine endopeptidase [Sulfurimonadaceae bacterium]
MKKSILLSTILVLSLGAASITFNDAPVVTERMMPAEKDVILSYNDAIKEAASSIVYISTKEIAPDQMRQMNPFFEQFFGHGMLPQESLPRQGLGSGVIISKDGYIATSNHVIDNADEITVSIGGDTTEYVAKVIGKDPKSDLAVIKIEVKKELSAILMGRSDNLEIGDVVFAIGNPFGVGQSVTQGIISAQNKDSIGINEYENFIQTDASINPGNSGGALVDSRGALVGINSAIMTRSGGNNGIGFAIEVNMVRDITKQLIESGTISRGYLGVSIGNLNTELRKLYKNSEGAMVLEVTPDSPAEKAGLKRGDLITQIDQKSVGSAAALKNSIGKYKPGSTVAVILERDKKMQTLKVKLGDLSSDVMGTQSDSALFKGLQLSNLDPKTRYNYRISEEIEGVLITDVDLKSEAYEQNIRPGDVIMQIEKYLTPDIATLKKVLIEYKDKYKRVYINRGGRVFVTAIK